RHDRRGRDRRSRRTRPAAPCLADSTSDGCSRRRNRRVICARTIFLVQELHVLVRVWLPDRPGALGLVASRIGAVDGDIVGIDVLERGSNVAVDEFAVILPTSDLVELLIREIEQVDGASVEEVRTVETFPDPRL